MKIFISQPMKGKTEEFIAQEREKALEQLTKLHPGAEIIDSHFKNIDWGCEINPLAKPLKYLSRSIDLLADADLAVFLSGWDEARGCRAEEMIAYLYGLKRLYF